MAFFFGLLSLHYCIFYFIFIYLHEGFQFGVAPIAFIGGSSFLESALLSSFKCLTFTTSYGAANIYVNDNRTIYYVQRHAANPHHEYSPPHLINHRATMSALHQCGIRYIIAFGSVGSLKKSLPVSSLVVPDDYYDPTPISMFEYDKRGHLSVVQ
jgi:5'-methylthioadenosine phosphorylase